MQLRQWSRWGLGLAVVAMVAGCRTASRSDGHTGTVGAFADIVARDGDAATLWTAVESGLLRSEGLRMRAEIRSEGVLASSLESELLLGAGRRARLVARGDFDGRPAQLDLRSDGVRLIGRNGDGVFDIEVPPALHEGLLIGLTRMGLLHNLAMLTGPAPPDGVDGQVREWLQVVDVSRGPITTLNGAEVVPLSFGIVVGGERAGEATLFVEVATGLPFERRQLVRFPNGEMRVVERYVFRPGPPPDASVFGTDEGVAGSPR